MSIRSRLGLRKTLIASSLSVILAVSGVPVPALAEVASQTRASQDGQVDEGVEASSVGEGTESVESDGAPGGEGAEQQVVPSEDAADEPAPDDQAVSASESTEESDVTGEQEAGLADDGSGAVDGAQPQGQQDSDSPEVSPEQQGADDPDPGLDADSPDEADMAADSGETEAVAAASEASETVAPGSNEIDSIVAAWAEDLRQAGDGWREQVGALFARLAGVEVSGMGTPESADADALAALKGQPSTTAGVTRAFKLVGQALGLVCEEVEGADGSVWNVVEIDGSLLNVDAAAAAGAEDVAWLLVTDDELAKLDPGRFALDDQGGPQDASATESSERKVDEGSQGATSPEASAPKAGEDSQDAVTVESPAPEVGNNPKDAATAESPEPKADADISDAKADEDVQADDGRKAPETPEAAEAPQVIEDEKETSSSADAEPDAGVEKAEGASRDEDVESTISVEGKEETVSAEKTKGSEKADAPKTADDKAQTYAIAFDANGGVGSMDAIQGCAYGESYGLPTSTLRRTGYAFAGWNTKADGSGTAYADGGKFVLSTPKGSQGGSAGEGDTTTITLFAQWKSISDGLQVQSTPVSYKITYQLRGGKNSAKNPATYTSSTGTITLANPTRTGYSFVGWYKDSACTKKVTSIPKGSKGNKTFYAKWKAKTYKITYKLNGGKQNTKNPKSYKVTTASIKLANPTRKGYKFGGWYSDAKFKTRVKTIAKGSTGNKTLYAKWTATKYKITYKLNGGKNSSKNPATYTITSNKISFAAPTRAGYTFGGWYQDSSFTKKAKPIAKGSTGNKVVYAKWTAHSYSIKFIGNGATSGSMASMTGLKYGKSYTLGANTFRRTNVVFAGWNTKADGTGTSYNNKASIKNLTTKNNGTVKLYAQWQDYVACTKSYGTDKGAVALIKNSYSKNVSVTATFVYYKGSSMVKTAKAQNSCLERGRTCALQGWIHDVDYTSYTVDLQWEEAASYLVPNASKISTSSSAGDNSVIVRVTNNGDTTDYTVVAVVLYKNGKAIGYDYHYAEVDEPGFVDTLEFYYPYTEDYYERIVPDSYQVFVNFSYRYE